MREREGGCRVGQGNKYWRSNVQVRKKERERVCVCECMCTCVCVCMSQSGCARLGDLNCIVQQ